jgi:hypothetical protein
MAIVVKFNVSGMSAEMYESALRQLDAAGGAAPHGRLHHITYGSPENLEVIDVYDSPESFEKFGRTLGPILAEFGIQAKPDVYKVYKIIDA